jgi:PPOX class probable F420-dependent enzyme
MDSALMRRRVKDARVARLATVRSGGQPHVVPCCFVLEGDAVYSAVDAKPKSTLVLQRLVNVQANPAASLLVDYYDEDWSTLWWVRLDGVAHVLDAGATREHALDLLAAKYEQYRRRRPPGAVLALDITGWKAWPSPR